MSDKEKLTFQKALEILRRPTPDTKVSHGFKVPAESRCFHCGKVYAECNGRQCGERSEETPSAHDDVIQFGGLNPWRRGE